MLDLLQYDFIVRGLQAGIVIALIAPLIGTFLVLKRYSLIADTLSHVSFAGVALGFLFAINPIWTALLAAVGASLGIEKLRTSKTVYGESALALFLSGSLALATILISLGHGFNANLFNYLFGSIVTVTPADVYTMTGLGVTVLIVILALYKELVFISFDEESARVAGIPVRPINVVLIVLAAITIALAIPVVGVLLISALVVIPVISALQLRRGFFQTILIAEVISLASVVAGIVLSFYLNLSTGGTIVLLMLGIFFLTFAFKK